MKIQKDKERCVEAGNLGSMNRLGTTIRSIRTRLGKTMVEFAAVIGAKQSTVSRYEAGKLAPGRPVLILLLQLAEGNEKAPILEALGIEEDLTKGWDPRHLIEALNTFETYLETPRDKTRGTKQGRGSNLVAFARAAKGIILAYEDIDPSVTKILNHWRSFGTDPSAQQIFRNAATYLDVELAAHRASKPVPLRRLGQ